VLIGGAGAVCLVLADHATQQANGAATLDVYEKDAANADRFRIAGFVGAGVGAALATLALFRWATTGDAPPSAQKAPSAARSLRAGVASASAHGVGAVIGGTW